MVISNNTFVELNTFLIQKKFIEDPGLMYPGAPDELVRVSAEVIINELTSHLIAGLTKNPTETFVFGQFELSLSKLENFDSEEQDRALSYLEAIMSILDIESSNGLLNNWRYGFDPT